MSSCWEKNVYENNFENEAVGKWSNADCLPDFLQLFVYLAGWLAGCLSACLSGGSQ